MAGKRDKSPLSTGCSPFFVLGRQNRSGGAPPATSSGAIRYSFQQPLWKEGPQRGRDFSTLPCALKTPEEPALVLSDHVLRPAGSRPRSCSTSKAFENIGLEREDEQRKNFSQQQFDPAAYSSSKSFSESGML